MHAEGQRFESVILHLKKKREHIDVLETQIKKEADDYKKSGINLKVFVIMIRSFLRNLLIETKERARESEIISKEKKMKVGKSFERISRIMYKDKKGKRIRAHGGCLRLPEAKKDVISCEKLR